MQTQGTIAPGYERVAEAFTRAFDGRPTMGAALAILVGGETVVDLWGGVADEKTGSLWEQGTATVVFSCTKGLVSILAARLVQEGRLCYDAPVHRYWPEFATAGKEKVTVGELLAHRAGLSAPRVSFTTEEILDWKYVTGQLAKQDPLWKPGTGYAYHAITHGWLVGEVIRRVARESVGDYFRRATAPWTRDAWIGLPASEAGRVAHIQVGESQAQAGRLLRDAPDEWTLRAMTLGGALPVELVGDGTGFNDPRVRAAQIPGAGGVATAHALASIWSATIVDTEGARLLDDATLDRALVPMSQGAPVYHAPGPWPRWGAGFQLDSAARRYRGPRSFGHDGAGGQVAFADPDSKTGFAFITNWMEAGDDRATQIIDALRAVRRD
ncbi:serine hydrolase domain-containing protein [Arthrobacter sp. efr-133-TYG-120]|uniref:serine hydrolase domain-containing protein n=1 Tax=Arthrobacter sp. efr-133-TYG-120 TaxID=3040280 RepID=UPI00254B75BE|nr:serine hydrolase domain-containing protein [Arthrobacter sp. efr-133-TYG-120]